ncbi:hypothetical protein ACB092_08G082900 [Castanea dentata]
MVGKLQPYNNNPNLEHICQTVHVYQSNVESSYDNNHDFTSSVSNQADPARVIREALSKALVYYYPLARKLKKNSDGKLQINCTADGVPFLVATSNCDLSSLHYLDGVDVEVTRQFVYDVPSEGDSGCHPLVLQVTKFSCGGFIIGMGLSHSVCDGFGAGQFLQALAELASGKNEPSVKPVWERERLVVTPTEEPFQSPVDNTSIATSPYFPTTDFMHECFYVSGDSIKRLKMTLMEECGSQNLNESFTTVEALAAYEGELNEAPFSKIVKIIKDTKKVASNSDYIMLSLVVLERFREVNIKFKAKGALMDFTDWRRLGFLDIDFGWKGPINIVPVPMNMIGYVDLCMFLPPSNVYPSKKDGVRVFISLPRAAMAKFKEEMDALKIAGDGTCVSAL